MNPNRPYLFLYFKACVFVVFFKIIRYDSLVLYSKAIVIPFIFAYYLSTNNFKISWDKAMIFLFCFVGDTLILFDLNRSGFAGLVLFSTVNLLLLKSVVLNFKTLQFGKNDAFPMLILFAFILLIAVTTLSLQYENIVLDFSMYIFHACILSFLCFSSMALYIKKGSHTFFNLVIMCICFILSDMFFMINKYYFTLNIFCFLFVFSHVFSYYFMTAYFVENDKYIEKEKSRC